MKIERLNNGRYVATLDNGLASGGWTQQEALEALNDIVMAEYNKAQAVTHMWLACGAEINRFVETHPD